jgi:hypothetical protein
MLDLVINLLFQNRCLLNPQLQMYELMIEQKKELICVSEPNMLLMCSQVQMGPSCLKKITS